MLKTIVHGFLSGLGFLLALAAVALALHNPFLALIPVVLLGVFWHRRFQKWISRPPGFPRRAARLKPPPPPTVVGGGQGVEACRLDKDSP
jgi:hypothetical protein